jgi:hypothetical protein
LVYLDFEIVSDFSTGHLTVDIRISNFCCLRDLASLWLKLYLPRRSLLAKTGQSKLNDYAKQTQFLKTENARNPLWKKGLRKKTVRMVFQKQTQTKPISQLPIAYGMA